MKVLATSLTVFLMASLPSAALEVQTGFDAFLDPDTTIEGLHRLYVGHSFGAGLSFGQSIYSAASGDAGGAFFWGYEGVKTWALAGDISAYTSGFVGGGGGASQVAGDGLMLRIGLGVEVAVADTWRLTAGVSHVAIDGGDEAANALSIGLSRISGAHASALPIRSVALRFSGVSYADALDRSGGPQSDLTMVGTEFSIDGGPTGEYFVSADGAARGGEGYMQVMAGLRGRVHYGSLSIFAEAAAGFGGGGQVDTGGGLLLQGGIGAGIDLSRALRIEALLARQAAPQSCGGATVATLRLARLFGDHSAGEMNAAVHRWRFSTGISQQYPNGDFRSPSSGRAGSPMMQESSVDLLLGDRLYITGNAQTVLGGDAAGYAIGLVGAGYQVDLSPRVSVSAEAHLGAAGGGSVAVSGGAIYSVRGEVDYRIYDGMSASIAVGRMGTLSGGGMAPSFVTVGLKFPFETH